METGMPLIQQSTFNPHPLLWNGHAQTLYPHFFRKVDAPESKRVRIDTKDGDFLNLDLYRAKAGAPLAILTHGLESSSRAHYILGMARQLRSQGINVVAWNMRSCGGELNQTPIFYHGASTEDLDEVINWSREQIKPSAIYLIGFSLGGNLTAFYLGERGTQLASDIRGGALVSTPVHLESTVLKMQKPGMAKLYTESFLSTMRQKVLDKEKILTPMGVDVARAHKVRHFLEFDHLYTAPIHGYKDAFDYYRKAQALGRLSDISVPTLLINGLDDPFLTPECFPRHIAEESQHFYLETPKIGGHVGFVAKGKRGPTYWYETRVCEFFSQFPA
jgi:hypothetical protein